MEALECKAQGSVAQWLSINSQVLTIFYGGQFGLSCACGVQLLDVQVEGRFLIDDGLSTVSAFVEANSQWEQEYVALDDLKMSAMLGGPGPSVSAGPGSVQKNLCRYLPSFDSTIVFEVILAHGCFFARVLSVVTQWEQKANFAEFVIPGFAGSNGSRR